MSYAECEGMDDELEPGSEPGAAMMPPGGAQVAQQLQRMHISQHQQQQQLHSHQPGQHVAAATSSPAAPASATYVRPANWPAPTLYAFLLNTPLNRILASFLPTRDLFKLQFLNRSCFTLLNSNAQLLKEYYETARLDSFIPFLVDDAFLHAFLTPTYLALPDGGTAVRNTYSMHIRHLHLCFCTRISNRSLQLVAQHIGPRLQSINLEGGGRSRINEQGAQILFASCNRLESVNLNGCYQLNMHTTIGYMIQHCAHTLRSISLNGCAQVNEQALALLANAKQLQSVHLNSVPLTDSALQLLASSLKDNLRALHIGYCGAVTDRGLAALVHYCRRIEDLSLYGCTGLTRHALSYLRLCPLLHTVDISRIHSLDDGSVAEWVLPTAALQQQQAMVAQLLQQTPVPAGHQPPHTHPDLNANLPAIFAAQMQFPEAALRTHAATRLRSVSLDSCSRISSLGLKVLLEQCPALTFCNAFGIANLTLLGLQSLLRICVANRAPLRTLQIGGSNELHSQQMDAIRREFKHINF